MSATHCPRVDPMTYPPFFFVLRLGPDVSKRGLDLESARPRRHPSNPRLFRPARHHGRRDVRCLGRALWVDRARLLEGPNLPRGRSRRSQGRNACGREGDCVGYGPAHIYPFLLSFIRFPLIEMPLIV